MTEDVKLKVKNKLDAKKPIILFVVGLLVVVAIWSIVENLKYQSTDDAYVETTTVNVAPKVSGEIIEVYVTDNQTVKKGDIIAKIDPRDYQVRVDQTSAMYQKELLNQTNALANRDAVVSELAVAKRDVERYTNLYNAGAVSKQTLDNAITKYDSLSARQVKANEDILSNGGNKVADANIKALKAQKDAAELNLSYTTIYAPQDGTVASRRVEKGMLVNAGTPLLTIVPHNVWVVANFKETQLKGMKPGMPVQIKIDTYPNKTFKGKIDSIQRSSGAKSSLFPPENAVGSFVKIVQRIPVKIIFDEPIDTNEYNIVPGMSVVPRVKVK